MRFKINDIDMSLMKEIPSKTALEMNIIALKNNNNEILFYTDEEGYEKKDYLSLIFRGRNINFVIGEASEVKALVEACYGRKEISKDKLIEEEFINLIIKGVESSTSDIHIEPLGEFANIRFRIDGTLRLVKKLKKDIYENLVNKIKLKGDMNIGDKLRAQDGKINFKEVSCQCDLRISTIPTVWGEKVVIRILYKKNELINIDSLSLIEEQKEKVNRLLNFRHGMIIVNGPTGSGKSTTLYALLNSIDKEGINISTIEDPVEFSIKGITQINVNEKVDLTFANGLKHILRQDPDVILIGEIRDENTAKIAIRASITGHKVYSTIHSNNGKEIYDRLFDMGAEKYLVKEGIIGIITQRLVRKICDKCKKQLPLEERELREFEMDFHFKGTGCSECNYTGLKGRRAVCEIILPKEYKSIEDIPWGDELLKSCLNLVREGEVSLDEYYFLKECEGLDAWC